MKCRPTSCGMPAIPPNYPFQTTAELPPSDEVIGQERAVKAIEFGLSITNHGYNIFVSGIPGTGRNSISRSIVQRISRDRPVPDDWCYINNFKDPDRPRAIKLPPGKGGEFRSDMEKFIEFMQNEIPKVFESKEYEEQKTAYHRRKRRRRRRSFLPMPHGSRSNSDFSSRSRAPASSRSRCGKASRLRPRSWRTFRRSSDMNSRSTKNRWMPGSATFFPRRACSTNRRTKRVHELNRRVAHFSMGHHLDDLKERYSVNPAHSRISGRGGRGHPEQPAGVPGPDAGAAVPDRGHGQSKLSRALQGESHCGQRP